MRILHCSRVSPGPLAPDFTPVLWSRTSEPREAQRAGCLDFRTAEDVRSGAGRAPAPPVCIVYTAAAADFASQFSRSEIRGAESERRAAATMLPYIHLGPLTLGTYGLMLATALLCGFFVLRADLNRRRLDANPETIIGLVGLAGLVGAKLWHVLESPADFFTHPLQRIFSSSGFAFYGSFLAGFLMLVLLARHYRMPLLVMLDVAAPAAALGYGIGRIGCLISGDGDYGIPTSLPWGMSFPNGLVPTTERVHPTPIYEFLAAAIIFYCLWRLGTRSPHGPRPAGEVFGYYLVLSGGARFLVEFIRLNPRSVFGLTNAQAASLLSILAGVAILLAVRQRIPATKRPGRE